jgi:hypothetical protein
MSDGLGAEPAWDWPRCAGAVSVIRHSHRIAITAAAHDAICSTMPEDAPPWPVQRQDGQWPQARQGVDVQFVATRKHAGRIAHGGATGRQNGKSDSRGRAQRCGRRRNRSRCWSRRCA